MPRVAAWSACGIAALAHGAIPAAGFDSLGHFFNGTSAGTRRDDLEGMICYYAAHWRPAGPIPFGGDYAELAD